MDTRKIFAPKYVFPVLAVVCTLLAAPDAFAQTVTHSGAQFDGLLKLIQQNSALWNGRLLGYAEKLFWSLAAIQLVMTFMPLAIRQADIGEIVHELIKYSLVIGFFYEILTRSTYWASAVVQSFRDAGGIAIGQSSALQPSDVFMLAVKFANTIGNVNTLNPLVGVSIGLASICVLLCFAFIAAFMAVTLIESYIVVNASVLLLGFGGSQWTREYAMAMPRYAVAVGAKLFVLTLLVGLISQSATAWERAYTHTDNASMWTMVGLAFTCAYLTKTIPDLIQGLISGISVGGGGTIGGMAAGAAAGAAIATGGVDGIAAGVANVAGGAAGSAGGAAAGGGLAGLIDSAVMGGTKAAGAMGGSSGGPSAASTIAPRVGGAASAAKPMNGTASTGASSSVGRASTGGAQANAAAPAQSAPSGTPSGASDAAAGEGATSSPSGPERASTAPGGAGGGAPASGSDLQPGQTASLTPGRATHMGLAGAVRTAGVLASISVPGMEGAHGISLGTPPTVPSDDPEDDPTKGPDIENVIQPAKDKP
ncbi:P-type conjugative transfer protein TrbL [Acidocella facilis]|uniref:P-type conjugative transfer protein TrbL n=1 Tax=Acidocella facilis TaxID=525 RepID=UPI0006916A7D|nr:P-type conjugative transfer protein TrbL [Acidocella facilis]